MFSFPQGCHFYEHPQSLSQFVLLELNFLGAKFLLSTLNNA